MTDHETKDDFHWKDPLDGIVHRVIAYTADRAYRKTACHWWVWCFNGKLGTWQASVCQHAIGAEPFQILLELVEVPDAVNCLACVGAS